MSTSLRKPLYLINELNNLRIFYFVILLFRSYAQPGLTCPVWVLINVDLFVEVSQNCLPTAIIATNTLRLDVASIAMKATHKEV